MKKLLKVLVCLISFISSSQEAEHFKTSDFNVAIFPAEYEDLLPPNRFTPSHEQVITAEKVLKTKLEKLNYLLTNQSSSPVIHKNLNKYLRQYFGYINEKGQHILLINCFWKNADQSDKKYWLNGRISVLDGGSFYWNVKYNLDTGELFDLEVNGYA
ncbi:hypothetical protein FUA48_13025 [Flavobacterium alkalisoli]|uniref:Nuclear transport factor 2 family protein n=1 Tax=Flavobacterium alkalisoli TaxID=2602769 RepID=A0A5B9FZN4_9FLAO|nr:hypothetical protein [Flavobacterium alkalisoli]QEE50462.1 hypothetical protein FUA48_13025 [Flavobacterium alkalisoli]